MSANEHDDGQSDEMDVIERLRAENAWLRGALEEIDRIACQHRGGAAGDMQRTARVALTRKHGAPA